MEKPLQSPIRMPGKNTTEKEVSSPSEGLHVGKGYDRENNVSCNFGTTLETHRNVLGRPLESKRSDKDLLNSGGEKLIPRELTSSDIDLIHIQLR